MKRTIGFICVLLFSGCMTLSSQTAQVGFVDPYSVLGIEDVQPNDTEQAGVILRFDQPIGASRSFSEELVMFNAIKGTEGKRTVIIKERVDRYERGSVEDAAVVTSEMVYSGSKEHILTTAEIDGRGAVLSLIEGSHTTGVGEFTITAWERSPVFPEEPVRLGDEWTYTERMMLEIKSWLLKDLDPKPMTIKARSTLTGFALVKGKRCAVIETVALQEQPFNFKILFGKLAFTTRTAVDETLYFDYSNNREMARIIKATARSTRPDGTMLDRAEIQSIEI